MNDEVQHPAKALEGVEPVACLVETEQGVMVWPISDIDEAETYCDEGEFPEPLYSASAVSALQARIAELEQDAARGEPVGFVMVPSGPTREMLNAAIDVDSFKLGDISPLGFRCSPQQLFERCYRAMLAAAPKETP